MKMPAFQFYPANWKKDLKVQSLTFEERGIWFELLCIMHESEIRGKLVINGRAIDEKTLARLIGCDQKTFKKTLDKLLSTRVAYQDEGGIIYNKRMVEDEKLIAIRREAGKKGGNPVLLNQKDNPQDNQTDKQTLTPASSSSSSTSFLNKICSTQVFEYLRSASPGIISDQQIQKETKDLINKYQAKKITDLQKLCEKWAGNIIAETKKEVNI